MEVQGKHEDLVRCWRENRDVCEALRGRDGEMHARVAVTVTDDRIRCPLVGEDGLSLGIVPCLYHGTDGTGEVSVCGDRRCRWQQLSSRPSTPDSYGTQPYGRLHLHRGVETTEKKEAQRTRKTGKPSHEPGGRLD